MTKNPFLNALAAIAYIAAVSLLMFYGPKAAVPQEDSVIMPIAMISLFTLSAAVMAYLFFYKPAELYLSDRKKEALKLFVSTVLIFGIITLVIFMSLLSGGFK